MPNAGTKRLENRLGRRDWLIISAVIAALALLSAAQIYLRQKVAGESPSGLRIVATNLLAWCPWVWLTSAGFRLGSRVPLVGRRSRLRHTLFHFAAATVTATIYLAYLTLFYFVFFPELMGPLTLATYPPAFGSTLGEFFLVAFLGYWLILAVGFGKVTWEQMCASEESYARRKAVPEKNAHEKQEKDRPSRLKIRSRGRVRYVDPHTIDWIEAEGSYVRLHVGETSLLYRRTLSSLVKELGETFVRIHRSSAVRLERVAELRPLSHGEAFLRLRNGRELKLSRSYRHEVETLLADPVRFIDVPVRGKRPDAAATRAYDAPDEGETPCASRSQASRSRSSSPPG